MWPMQTPTVQCESVESDVLNALHPAVPSKAVVLLEYGRYMNW